MHRENEIINWASERGIYANSTALDQFKVMQEEINEALIECARLLQLRELGYDSKTVFADLKMELGDILVTHVNVCKFFEIKGDECLELAWQKIDKRTGKMIKGKFVKDSDLKTDDYDENGAVVEGGRNEK